MASITKKGTGWEWMQSWYILLTLPMGLTSFAAFLYVWIRGRRFSWLLSAIVYFAIIWVPAYLMVPSAEQANSTVARDPDPMSAVWGFVFFGAWIVSIIHAIIIRKKFLITLEAQEEIGIKNTDRMRTEIRAQSQVLDNRVDETLIKFKEDDITVKLCRSLFSALPFAPDFRYYYSIDGAAERLVFDKAEAQEIAERARAIARQSDDIVAAVKVCNAIDTADGGLGIVTGVRNVYSHMKDKERERTFEADPQQAADAALKAFGIAYMISRLYEGSITEKLNQFFKSKAGQEIMLYFAAAEIALPFTDNLVEGGGNLINDLLEKQGAESESRFSSFLGSGPLAQAKPVLDSMTEHIDGFLAQVRLYTDPLMKKAQEFAPSVMNAADSVTGGIATAVDFLPAWKFLGARLAAETCVERAMAEKTAQAPGPSNP